MLYKNRNKLTGMITLGDLLGRSLRENVELFSVNGDMVTYITESGNVVQGVFDDSKNLTLKDIKIESVNIFKDAKLFDSYVNKKVVEFVNTLRTDKITEANIPFKAILDLWNSRLHFDRITRRLAEKVEHSKKFKILSSDEFKRLSEIKEKLIELVEDSKDKILQTRELRNSIKLSNVLVKAFNLPKLTLTKLKESKNFVHTQESTKAVYEIVCRQELVKKELYESKKDFDEIWATNDKVVDLINEIYAKTDTKLLEKIQNLIAEVPYFALATVKQLRNIFVNSLALNENKIPDKDISAFITRIYEVKKPFKELFLSVLNEKYGVNFLNLKDVPSFSSLANAQTVVFESLAKLAPKNSIIRQTLLEMSKLLRNRAGVECLDLNEYIAEVFKEGGVSELVTEASMTNYIDFNKVAADLGAIGDVLRSLMGTSLAGTQNPQMGAPAANPAMGINGGGPAASLPNQQGAQSGGEEMYPSDETLNTQAGPGGGGQPSPLIPPNPNKVAQSAKAEVQQEIGAETGMAPEEELAPEEGNQDQMVAQVQELEQLINTLKADMGVGDMQSGGIEGEEELPMEDPNAPDGVEDELGGTPVEVDAEGEESEEGGEEEVEKKPFEKGKPPAKESPKDSKPPKSKESKPKEKSKPKDKK